MEKPLNIKYEVIVGFKATVVPDDVASKIAEKVGYTKYHFPLTAIVGAICSHYGADGCRAYGIKSDSEDVLCRDYIYAYNSPMETHLWHL